MQLYIFFGSLLFKHIYPLERNYFRTLVVYSTTITKYSHLACMYSVCLKFREIFLRGKYIYAYSSREYRERERNYRNVNRRGAFAIYKNAYESVQFNDTTYTRILAYDFKLQWNTRVVRLIKALNNIHICLFNNPSFYTQNVFTGHSVGKNILIRYCLSFSRFVS